MRLMASSRKAIRNPIWVKDNPCWRKNSIMNGSKYRWFFRNPYRENRLIIIADSSNHQWTACHVFYYYLGHGYLLTTAFCLLTTNSLFDIHQLVSVCPFIFESYAGRFYNLITRITITNHGIPTFTCHTCGSKYPPSGSIKAVSLLILSYGRLE